MEFIFNIYHFFYFILISLYCNSLIIIQLLDVYKYRQS